MLEYRDKRQALKPLDKPPTVYPIGAFDIEGVGGPDGFESGAILVDGEYLTFDTPQAMVACMKRRKYKGYRFAAHNLMYDFGILEPYLSKQDYPLLLNGRPFKVSLYTSPKSPAYMVDNLLFAAGLSLKKLGQTIGLPKLDTPPQLTGDYDNATEWTCDAHNKLWCIDCYLQRDVEIVYRYLTLFQDTINQAGGQMRFTLASTAMDVFRRRYLNNIYYTPLQYRNDFARQAYYGGRVEPYRVGYWSDINVYDVNSLYPYVMRTFQYPHPNYLVGPISNPSRNLIDKYEGVSDVEITIPDTFIPPLPYRADGKLYFAVGKRRACYTHIELRYALEHGATLHHIYQTLYSLRRCNPFREYVDDLYAQRIALKQVRDPRQVVFKIMLNSLYGKFGQRQNAGLQEIRSFDWWYNGHINTPVFIREINGFVTVIIARELEKQANYINTLWAAYVTAYARLTLLKFMSQAGDSLFYVDTDSVFIQGELACSQELGDMKTEYANVDAEIIGPKAYRLFRDGVELKVKCKGVPADKRSQFLSTGECTFSRPVGLLEAAHLLPRSDGRKWFPSEWRDVMKVKHFTTPKRTLIPENGPASVRFLTRPFRIEEL